MKPITPAIALLALALAACTAERTPDAAAPADNANAMANDPAAPPPLEQPVEDVPPATAPGNVNQSPDLGLVRMDGYGDMRFGMTAEAARQAWGRRSAERGEGKEGVREGRLRWSPFQS